MKYFQWAEKYARVATRRSSKRVKVWQAVVMLLALVVGSVSMVLYQHNSAQAEPTPLRILTIGDSMSEQGIWQDKLSEMLTSSGIPNEIVDVSVGGTNCHYWTSRLTAALQAHNPDLLVISCGTNDDPNQKIWGEPITGWSLRTLIETAYNWRPSNRVKVLTSLIQYSDPKIAPDWLLSNEPRTNDILYRNMLYYPRGTILAGIADFQYIPSTATYLDSGGIHPTDRGYGYMARIAYDAAKGTMGWPELNPEEYPPLCDLYGHRKGFARPSFVPCVYAD